MTCSEVMPAVPTMPSAPALHDVATSAGVLIDPIGATWIGSVQPTRRVSAVSSTGAGPGHHPQLLDRSGDLGPIKAPLTPASLSVHGVVFEIFGNGLEAS